ncbi:hypothetical protein PL321_02710 [Caloramator sp. mosi_1]|uniref:hypothetical protein n=1 Tax=Caloramator sp. mosi_1 TaxID=3023090 RepID=UPI0023621695|nr:hypothetical protein [Caloramator sp. mosi_1]WDC84634.1 hypothetical protein PL321_02710 [Caloramator sp. mosi_1]
MWVLNIKDSKICYYKINNDITDGTNMFILDTKTNKTEKIENNIYVSEILHLNNKYVLYSTTNNDLRIYNLETKEESMIYNDFKFFEGYLSTEEKIFLFTQKITENVKLTV